MKVSQGAKTRSMRLYLLYGLNDYQYINNNIIHACVQLFSMTDLLIIFMSPGQRRLGEAYSIRNVRQSCGANINWRPSGILFYILI